MGAMALHGYSSMELKSRSFTSKEPHVAREPQVSDPWSMLKVKAAGSSEMTVNIYHTTRTHIPEHIIFIEQLSKLVKDKTKDLYQP
jgi:hypothetical protein